MKNWILAHKLSSLLIVVIIILLTPLVFVLSIIIGSTSRNSYQDSKTIGISPMSDSRNTSLKQEISTMSPVAPLSGNDTFTTSQERKVSKEYYLSLVINDMRETLQQVNAQVIQVGGFVVSSNMSNPVGDANGDMSIRVPSDKAEKIVSFLRDLGKKVIFENTSAQDLTAQYQDIEARMNLLTENKNRFEEIMRKAITTEDILNVQKEIFSLQEQIDTLTGQQRYIKEISKYSHITVTFTTRDGALSQNPNEKWNVKGVFEEAFDALKGFGVGIATFAIWILVFGFVWIPILAIVILIKKRFGNKINIKK
ncbi:MAG: DUF4349 domain-containing protein [Candidatus Roizmanbacteria bacterium]